MVDATPARLDECDLALLVARAKDGDAAALERLCALCYDEILEYFRQHIPEHAEDLTQKLFAGLDRKLDGYVESGRFRAWLRGVAYHLFLTQLRFDRRRIEQTLHTGFDVADPVTTTILKTAKGKLRDLVGRLSPLLRDAWNLHVQGYGPAEIADALDITPGAAMTRVSRAKTLLTEWLTADERPQGQ
jgi:RNA polymerase sigma factor (sigma-70 family)